MSKYTVDIRVTGHYVVTVDASSPEEACDIAQDMFEDSTNEDLRAISGDTYSITDSAGKTLYMF